jgi:hypothetical protein
MVIKNQKARALVATVGMVALIAVAAVIVQLVTTYLDRQTVMQGLAGIMILGLLYTLYNIFLAKIQYEDKVREIARKTAVDQK